MKRGAHALRPRPNVLLHHLTYEAKKLWLKRTSASEHLPSQSNLRPRRMGLARRSTPQPNDGRRPGQNGPMIFSERARVDQPLFASNRSARTFLRERTGPRFRMLICVGPVFTVRGPVVSIVSRTIPMEVQSRCLLELVPSIPHDLSAPTFLATKRPNPPRLVIVRVLRHELAAYGEVEDGLAQCLDLVGALGERRQRVKDEAGVGLGRFRNRARRGGRGSPRQPIAHRVASSRAASCRSYRHQFIDFIDDALLLGKRWEGKGSSRKLAIEIPPMPVAQADA